MPEDFRNGIVFSSRWHQYWPRLEFSKCRTVQLFFLTLLRARLDKDKVAYEYLDGRTRDRETRVTRFQEDPKIPLLLITLKAGGVGLNLTAADGAG